MIHQIAKGAWTYDSSVNKGPEICWQLVLCPSPKQLAQARDKLCGAGQTLAEWAQERWFLCSFRSQGSVLQTRASWIPVIIKGSSAQVKESVIRPLFVSYLQGFDVPVVFLWLPQGMLLPFSHFIIFFDSELPNSEMVLLPSTIFFFFWATVFTLVKSLCHPRSKGRTFLNSSPFQRIQQCLSDSPDHHLLIPALVPRTISAQSSRISCRWSKG